jgi:hypothetical protein
MALTRGLPSAADLILIKDSLAAQFKAQYANIGTNAPSETTTLAAKAQLASDKILGDGAAYYGISNSDLQAMLQPTLKNLPRQSRYDVLFKQFTSGVFTQLDNWILQNLPSGWNFASSSGNRPIDLWLLYLNACSASVPATPSITPTLTATTGGTIGQTGVIRVKVCYQSSSGDWLVSQPSTASSTITLSGKNNAISVALSGNAAVSGYVLVFRQKEGAAVGDPYYFDQRVACTSGEAHPAITCKLSDQQLRLDLNPPSYMQCMMLPEAAMLFALAYASFGTSVGAQMGLPTFQTQSFLSPANVTLNPVSGFLGLNNPAATGTFAQWVSTAFAEGTLATANDATNVIQGFAGAGGSGVQLRVTSALNANAPITNVDYYYYDATNPTSLQGPTTIAAPGTLNLSLGQTLDLGIPAGRLVTRISAMTVGTAVTGTLIAESKALRSI